jgi:hypothetical protein
LSSLIFRVKGRARVGVIWLWMLENILMYREVLGGALPVSYKHDISGKFNIKL